MNYKTNTFDVPPEATPGTQAYFNQKYADALAAGDPRYNQKQFDRAGVSRGRGSASEGGLRGAQTMAKGIADAYSVPMTDTSTDANNTLAYESNRERFGNDMTSLQNQNDYATALAALQRQQMQQNYQTGVLGGLMGSMGSIAGSNAGGGGNWLDTFLGY
jgi:hypothetical protein